MAEKVSNGISSSIARSCNSKRSAAGTVTVTHISNPTTVVKANPSEFCAVVQSLTGQKRSAPSSSEYEEINLCSDNEYSPRGKAPKLLNDELQCFNDVKSSESAIIDDKATVGVCCNDRDLEDVSIFEELGVLPILNPGCVVSHQVFQAADSTGDTRHILFDIFSPSTQFSEFEHLQKGMNFEGKDCTPALRDW